MLRFVIVLMGLVFALSVFSHVNAEPPSAYEFKRASDFSRVELSPSGKYLAFVRTQTQKVCLGRVGETLSQDKAKCKDKNKVFRNQHILNIFNIEDNKAVRRIDLGENLYVSWLEWASDERLLAAVYRPTTVGKSAYSLGGARVFSFPLAEEAEAVVLFEDQKRVGRQNRSLTRITNLLRSDPDHIIMPARRNSDLDLWKVNVKTGAATRIARAKPRTFFWYTDRQGRPTLRFDCNNRRCRKIKVFKNTTLTLDNDIQLGAEILDWEWEHIKTFEIKPDDEEDDYDFWPIAPTENFDQYYVISKEDTDARRSIKIFDLSKKEYVKTVYEHPIYDVGGALTNLQTGEYAGAWYYDDRLNYHITDSRSAAHYKAIQKFFDNDMNVHILGYSANGDKVMTYVKGPSSPGTYYVYDFTARMIDPLISRKADLEKNLKSKTEVLSIPTRDGKTITAYRSYPAKQSGASAPLIVMPHGGPEARDYYDYDSTVQFLVSRGYQVLQPNFRGSSGYGKDFAEAGYGEWGGRMHDDVTDSVNYLYSRGIAKAENSCIVGYSYGGFAALYAGAKTPDLYRCIISGGGVSDPLLDLKRTKKDYGADSSSYEYWLKSIGDPKADKAKIEAFSPINLTANYKAPVLLIHGEDDGIVHAEQSQKMYKALKKAGVEVEYLELEEEGHYGWDLENHILYLETLEAFLSKHLSLSP